jgi:hypothetical protein
MSFRPRVSAVLITSNFSVSDAMAATPLFS